MNYRSDSNRLPRGGRKRADAVRPASSRFFQARTFKKRFDKLIGRKKHHGSPDDTGRHKHEKSSKKVPGIAERRAALSPAALSSDIDSPRVGGRLKPRWRGVSLIRTVRHIGNFERRRRATPDNAECEFDKAAN